MVTSAISNFFLLLSYSTLWFFWVFYTKHVWDAIQIHRGYDSEVSRKFLEFCIMLS